VAAEAAEKGDAAAKMIVDLYDAANAPLAAGAPASRP
jgi:hypothetical protein